MLKLVYLSDGQQCYLIETISESKFIVDPIVTVETHEGSYDVESHAYRIVDKIYDKPPVMKIADEVKEQQAKLSDLKQKQILAQKELSETQYQIVKEKTSLSDLSKWKVDLSKFKTCKRICFFMPDELYMIVTDKPKYSYHLFRLTFQIDIQKGEETNWVTKYDGEGYSAGGYKDKIDEEYGFMFDLSDEEIDRLTIERINKKDMSSYTHLKAMENLPEKYRTTAISNRIIELKEKQRLASISSYEKQLSDITEKLNALKATA